MLVCSDLPTYEWNAVFETKNDRECVETNNRFHCREELLEFFPPDQLPCHYGGSCQCKAEDTLFTNVDEVDLP